MPYVTGNRVSAMRPLPTPVVRAPAPTPVKAPSSPPIPFILKSMFREFQSLSTAVEARVEWLEQHRDDLSPYRVKVDGLIAWWNGEWALPEAEIRVVIPNRYTARKGRG